MTLIVYSSYEDKFLTAVFPLSPQKANPQLMVQQVTIKGGEVSFGLLGVPKVTL